MTEGDRGTLPSLLGITAQWVVGLASLALLFRVWTSAQLPGGLAPWRIIEGLAGSVGRILPFAVFAGGLAAAGLTHTFKQRLRIVVAAGSVAAVASYGLFAGATPYLEVRADAAAGEEVAQRYPLGARTPVGLVRLLGRARDTNPDEYSFSTDRPLDRPPNWIELSLHLPVALAAFSIVNALLGLVAGCLTLDLPAARRRYTRWALGLLSATAFFGLSAWSTTWVRGSPSRPGALPAWLPVLVFLAVLAVAYTQLQRVESSDSGDRLAADP